MKGSIAAGSSHRVGLPGRERRVTPSAQGGDAGGAGGCGSPSAHFRAHCHPRPVTPSRHAPLSRAGGGCGGSAGAQLGLSSLCPAAASQEPVSMAGQCDTIYKGFADCLISLGDSMVQRVRQQQQQEEEGGEEEQELDTICK